MYWLFFTAGNNYLENYKGILAFFLFVYQEKAKYRTQFRSDFPLEKRS
jgi:hypothetical protein